MTPELLQYNAVMLAHAGEIGIKSKTTRRFMIKTLYRNISAKFPDYNLKFKNIANRSIIYTIFGVSHTAPIFLFTWTDYQHLLTTFTSYAKQFIVSGQSFGYTARTTGQNRPPSQNLKVELGSELYEAFNGTIKVDLTHPDVLFNVEVRDQIAWIYHQSHLGLDGFPQGAQKGIIFGNLRFWLADYYASYLVMKRGVNVQPVRFVTSPELDTEEETFHQDFLKKFYHM